VQGQESKKAGPMSAEQFVASLREGVDATHFITMRGRHIPVRILDVDEVGLIRRESLSWQAKESRDDTDRNLHVMKLTLAMATRMKPNEPPVLSEKVLGLVTLDELTHLYESYLLVLGKVNPALEEISGEQFRALVDAVKKKLVGWKELSLPQLKAIFKDWEGTILKQAEPESPPASGSGG
jgi:hypothetical protein